MSTLSELLPSGGGSDVADFVASGALPNGKSVVLKSDGTVEVVGETTIPESIPSGSETVFNAADTSNSSAISFDPNTVNSFIMAYQDGGNSNYGTVVVGTVSGTSLTFGTESVFNSAATYAVTVAFDPNTAGKFIVAYADGGNGTYATVKAGTISGSSITYGSAAVFSSVYVYDYSISFDPNTANSFVISHADGYGKVVVGTLSGVVITLGSVYTYNATSTNNPEVSFDPSTANKFVIAYSDTNGRAIVGTVSGTSISFGTAVAFNPAATSRSSLSFDPHTANKFAVVYMDEAGLDYGTAIVGTVSGTSISYGSEYVFNSGNTQEMSIAFDPSTINKLVISYRDVGNSGYGTAIVGTVSGTSLSFGTESIFNSANTYHVAVAFDPDTAGKFVVAYYDVGNSNYGTAIIGQLTADVTNLTATNFVGITTKAIADTATGSVTLRAGVSTNQTGLTIGSTYYVQADGTVSTVSTAPAVNIGKALNATTLKLKRASLMSTLSELLPAGGGGATVDFVASGTLPNGKPVVLKADGTVEVVAESTVTGLKGDTPVVFESATALHFAVAMLTSTKVIVAYSDDGNSGAGTACILDISGSTITAGTPLTFNNVYGIIQISIAALTSTKAIVTYKDGTNSSYGTANILDVSGSTITAGSAAVFNSATTTYTSVAMLTSTKAIVCYGYYGKARILDVSGTAITVGSELYFSGNTAYIFPDSVKALTATKAIVAYRNVGGSGYGTSCILDVSGSTITAGTLFVFNSADTQNVSTALLTSTKAIVAYKDDGNSSYGTSIILDVSGSTITAGSAAVFNSASTINTSVTALSSTEAITVYRDQGNSSYGTGCVLAISGSTITAGSKAVFENATSDKMVVAALTTKKAITAYTDSNNGGYGTATVLDTEYIDTNLTTTNFVGTSTAAYTNAETATIAIQGGLSTNQTGLTIGSTYYVQGDGTFATTADTISVNAGKALSATTLLLKDL